MMKQIWHRGIDGSHCCGRYTIVVTGETSGGKAILWTIYKDNSEVSVFGARRSWSLNYDRLRDAKARVERLIAVDTELAKV